MPQPIYVVERMAALIPLLLSVLKGRTPPNAYSTLTT